ncbi:GAF domain-containing protein [Sandaracinus amylolyticus]|uniref:GAF domain-containing protein n=1 Tax=Sandaracinus amylolyticus TaxID=927083 RepID=UPI00069E2C38|nr:GAF domain-containing protein [Sandaracinus amylolyticus]
MSQREPELPLSVQVHERGDAALEGVLRLIDEAARPRPLSEVLAALCAEVSQIVGCEIVSIYLREKHDDGEDLRIAANVGFPAGAIQKIRLHVGEGIVGHVAQKLRPVSVELAPTDPRFKAFPELGEERYPIFLAVPLLVGRRAEGVMVLQRSRERWAAEEVVLATALASSFAYALERARVRRSEVSPSKESRRARLEGESLSPGSELGRVETLPTFEGLAARWAAMEAEQPADVGVAATWRASRVKDAFETLVRDLSKARKKVAPKLDGAQRTALESLALLESDSRFLEMLAEEGAKGGNIPLALRKVAREYAQAPYKSTVAGSVQGWLAERAEEVEELCLLIAARSVGERVPTGNAALLVPERLSAVVALAAVAHKTAAIAVGNSVEANALGPAIARAAGVPAVSGVGGLFAWARAGDVVLVEGDEGVVRVNPTATQIARFRQKERVARETVSPPPGEGGEEPPRG